MPNQHPLPHQPQPHFYGAPEIDFGLPSALREGLVPGGKSYACMWDSLGKANCGSAQKAQNVLLVGSEGGFEVYKVGRGSIDVIGSLDDLHGSVIRAKILPWLRREDPLASLRPLVALVIHGPVVEDPKAAPNLSSSSSAVTDDNGSSSSPPTRPASNHSEAVPARITHYQTRVEVYSLKEHKHVATLYKSQPIPLATPIDNRAFEPPPPADQLTVDANGDFMVVASGNSGELFVFALSEKVDPEHPEQFRCIGKTWTTVQVREHASVSSASSSTDINSHEGDVSGQHRIPLFSLSQRWLATVPPATSSIQSSNGTALVSKKYPRPLGITSHAAPPQPAPNCIVDAPDPPPLLQRAVKEGTQQLLKGARWATAQGKQAWTKYWAPSPTPSGQIGGSNGYAAGYAAGQQAAQFPPTHGHWSLPVLSDDPPLVSILDLRKLHEAPLKKDRHGLTPKATFASALGCSFLSFAPNGLMLFMASKKGDHQFVYELKPAMHSRPIRLVKGSPPGAYVREATRFERVTVANVVDVVWSEPEGLCLAVLTDKGTVHVHELLTSAFNWPPPRRPRPVKAAPKADPNNDGEDQTQRKNWGGIGSAMQAINEGARTVSTAVRTGSASGGPGLPAAGLRMTSAAGAKGAKAVAAGITKSLGAASKGVKSLRHAGNNKLHLPSLVNGVLPGSVRWMTGNHRGHVGLVAGGDLVIYAVSHKIFVRATSNGINKASTTKVKRYRGLLSERQVTSYTLPKIKDSLLPPAIATMLDRKDNEAANIPPKVDGHFTLKKPAVSKGKQPIKRRTHPLAQAELETCAPFEPFHLDRRVKLFTYDTSGMVNENGEPQTQEQIIKSFHHVNDDSPWCFGGDIPTAKVTLTACHPSKSVTGAHFEGEESLNAAVDCLTLGGGGDGEDMEVVITTRHRRPRGGQEGDDGFFEDDCEVLDLAEDRV
ncbi:hypothetical protein W97_02442 [Coniosporium apollinis CBS 100218]|uniref:BCAS3 domain-containing protein n=1 Tax=Coniosporium apollinis (strain CBS 100218) TaxID=1168221 RepID=R7YMQ7_CONA1|nr:uncharacterized protein W97_02442 [Coniosporium apollinis CBS 100218]EON63215.1 hypothetical protein W97_02442 [Coniosporium apollinis CBS 100218]